jgi:hypothetical protein
MLSTAIKAAQAAGTIIKKNFSAPDDSHTQKDFGDLVTSTDIAAEKTIIKTLENTHPDHGYYSEERGGHNEDRSSESRSHVTNLPIRKQTYVPPTHLCQETPGGCDLDGTIAFRRRVTVEKAIRPSLDRAEYQIASKFSEFGISSFRCSQKWRQAILRAYRAFRAHLHGNVTQRKRARSF